MELSMRHNLGTLLISLTAGAALTACSGDSTSPNASGRSPVTVSFATASTTSASADRISANGAPSTSSAGADALVITKAQLVVRRVELQRVGATCASDEAAGDDDHGVDEHECAELELAPSLIDLPINSSVATALNVAVPAGSYSSLEAKIAPVGPRNGHEGKGSTAFLTAHPDLAGVSVRVEGTFNGKAFVYTGSPNAKIETEFDPPLAVTENSGANITFNVDLTNWFKTPTGAFIDPSTASAGSFNALLIDANIRRSFRAFRDNDHDGHEDHDSSSGKH
jgi:hypothetical protein